MTESFLVHFLPSIQRLLQGKIENKEEKKKRMKEEDKKTKRLTNTEQMRHTDGNEAKRQSITKLIVIVMTSNLTLTDFRAIITSGLSLESLLALKCLFQCIRFWFHIIQRLREMADTLVSFSVLFFFVFVFISVSVLL